MSLNAWLYVAKIVCGCLSRRRRGGDPGWDVSDAGALQSTAEAKRRYEALCGDLGPSVIGRRVGIDSHKAEGIRAVRAGESNGNQRCRRMRIVCSKYECRSIFGMEFTVLCRVVVLERHRTPRAQWQRMGQDWQGGCSSHMMDANKLKSRLFLATTTKTCFRPS